MEEDFPAGSKGGEEGFAMRVRLVVLVAGMVAVVWLAGGRAGAAAAKDHTTASAQGQSGLGKSAPTIQAYSRETVVDVTVTDNDGEPVHGLQQSDFVVEENGKPQPIRSFQEFDADAGMTAQPEGEPLPELPPGVYSNYQTVPASGPVNIFLLDAFHADFADVYREREAIRKYLQGMPAGTECAIFWLSGSGLHLLQGFTSDNGALYRGINRSRFEVGSDMGGWTRDWYTVAALEQIAEYVASIKGRKNLLWFTPGMPVMLTRDGGYGWGDLDMGRVHRLMDAYEMLTAQQVALYPVDPRGVRMLGRTQLRAEEVADAMGGLALYGSNDLTGMIRQAIDHGSHFYTLSYIPPNPKEDGHYHQIKIEVDKPGMHLVYRKGYNAEDPPRRGVDAGGAQMKAAMEGDTPPATQLLFDAQVSAGAEGGGVSGGRKSADLARYDILYSVPQSQIAFSDNADGSRVGSLEFDAVAYDNNHKRVAVVKQTMKLPLSGDEYEEFVKTPFRFSQQIELPPGEILVRAGVLDGVSNKVGTVEVPLSILDRPRRVAAQPAVMPPLCPPRCAMRAPEP
jgi:VWFA-related protein